MLALDILGSISARSSAGAEIRFRPHLQAVMLCDMDANTDVNRALWDELAPLHAASAYYDVPAFVAGASTLGEIELREVGPVAGQRMAHLMCHIGLDTLSWARLGARVTGLDFSAESVRRARELAARAGVEAEFVQAEVGEAEKVLDGPFDVVFLSKGVLAWIEDLDAWAGSCVRLLRPGGTFYLLELHPLAIATTRGPDGLAVTGPYFHVPQPTVVVADGSYAVSDAGLRHQESREWAHSLGETVTALARAGLAVEFLHEFPAGDGDGDGEAAYPLPAMFSIRGRRS